MLATATKMIIVCLALASILPTVLLAQSNWDQGARDFVLDMHNDLRRGEGGCQMNKLEYDMELESQAKQWAEGCIFKHELLEGRGENLAWDSKEGTELELSENAIQSWFDEKQMYYYGQYSCGMSCHYTQLVWANTTKVGCYSTRCANLMYAYRNAWYLVCFYTPKGNWNGEKPYLKSCPSQCKKGQTEDNGLCEGQAEVEPEVAEEKNEEKCVDDNGQCKEWAKNNQCVINPIYMKDNCRKSCGVCKGVCEDNESMCVEWANKGECKRNPSYMLSNCKKSCNNC